MRVHDGFFVGPIMKTQNADVSILRYEFVVDSTYTTYKICTLWQPPVELIATRYVPVPRDGAARL